jgi:apoptosis-inducing factor 3
MAVRVRKWFRFAPTDFYQKDEIELLLKTWIGAIDPRNKVLQLTDGKQRKFDALLLATGAEPVKLKIPGADLAHVCYLRSQSDCRTIIAKAGKAKHIVLVVASFIAMEVASALIQRNFEVHIVAPEEIPMATVLGPEVGAHLRRLHERNGAVFHLQQSVVAIDERKVTLKDGQTVNADLVVIGIGVKPLIDLSWTLMSVSSTSGRQISLDQK